jgi:GH24 family phage-related lysozyme (muramidase)
MSSIFGDAEPPPVEPAPAPKPVLATFIPAATPIASHPVLPVLPPSPVPGCDPETWAAYEKLLALREGTKYVVYYDSLGKPTGGIGHLLLPSDGLVVGAAIPDATVRRWFQHDGASAMDRAVTLCKAAGITSQPFLPYLASVCYQLGLNWIAKFPKTWTMILQGDYDQAATALNGTIWQKQTPVRVADFQFALRALPAKKAA